MIYRAFFLAFVSIVVAAQTRPESIIGTWRGGSVCVEKNTSCHDEIAVYHIAPIPHKPSHVFVAGSKVVDGKEIVMGSGDWLYDSEKQTITSEGLPGVVTLQLRGSEIVGTFTLPDKKVLRKITMTKSN